MIEFENFDGINPNEVKRITLKGPEQIVISIPNKDGSNYLISFRVERDGYHFIRFSTEKLVTVSNLKILKKSVPQKKEDA